MSPSNERLRVCVCWPRGFVRLSTALHTVSKLSVNLHRNRPKQTTKREKETRQTWLRVLKKETQKVCALAPLSMTTRRFSVSYSDLLNAIKLLSLKTWNFLSSPPLHLFLPHLLIHSMLSVSPLCLSSSPPSFWTWPLALLCCLALFPVTASPEKAGLWTSPATAAIWVYSSDLNTLWLMSSNSVSSDHHTTQSSSLPWTCLIWTDYSLLYL